MYSKCPVCGKEEWPDYLCSCAEDFLDDMPYNGEEPLTCCVCEAVLNDDGTCPNDLPNSERYNRQSNRGAW